MAAFLSDSWFAELETKARAASAPPDLALVIEQVVEGDADERWQVQISGGDVRIVRDGDGAADVRIRTDAATAEGINAGATSAQRAFLDGRLQIGGDVQLLMQHRETLADLGLGLA